MAARQEEGRAVEKIEFTYFLVCKGLLLLLLLLLSHDDVGVARGIPYFRRYGRELVSKPAISRNKCWGGYYRVGRTLGQLPRFSFSELEPLNIGGHQSLERNHLAYINLATDRQQRAYRTVRQPYTIYVARLHHRNAPIMAITPRNPSSRSSRTFINSRTPGHHPP